MIRLQFTTASRDLTGVLSVKLLLLAFSAVFVFLIEVFGINERCVCVEVQKLLALVWQLFQHSELCDVQPAVLCWCGRRRASGSSLYCFNNVCWLTDDEPAWSGSFHKIKDSNANVNLTLNFDTGHNLPDVELSDIDVSFSWTASPQQWTNVLPVIRMYCFNYILQWNLVYTLSFFFFFFLWYWPMLGYISGSYSFLWDVPRPISSTLVLLHQHQQLMYVPNMLLSLHFKLDIISLLVKMQCEYWNLNWFSERCWKCGNELPEKQWS